MRPLGKVEGHAGVVFQLRTLIHFNVALLRWMVDNITEFIEREKSEILMKSGNEIAFQWQQHKMCQ